MSSIFEQTSCVEVSTDATILFVPQFPYLISPLEAIQAKARENRTTVSWHLDNFDIAGANSTALRRDAVLVFISSDSGEGYITVDGNEGDRKNLTAWKNGGESSFPESSPSSHARR